MKILLKDNTVPASLQVKRVGKFLYKHLDGAKDIKFSSNMCDVYFTLLYQIPRLQRVPGKGKEYNDVHEMTIDLNITTYQNKVRVNILEVTPNQKTISYLLYQPESLMDLEHAKRFILSDVCKKLNKEYRDYDFIY